MLHLHQRIAGQGRSIAANFMHLGLIQVSNALVQLLLFPVIIRRTGIEAFGPVVVANSFAAMAGLVINYGTSISGISAVAAVAKGQEGTYSRIFCETLAVRCWLLAPVLVLTALACLLAPQNLSYLVLALPLVLAEILNPLYFFNGREQLLPFNAGNLCSKLVAVLLVTGFVKNETDAPWVNFWLGLPSMVLYVVLSRQLFRQLQLRWVRVSMTEVLLLLRKNLPLAGNNLAVQLQQSFFLFLLSGTGNALLLGAYALADKVIWGFRLLLISFSNALFPRAVGLAHRMPALARKRKRQINLVLAVVFLLAALVLYLFPQQVVVVFAGQQLSQATTFIRAIALVPFLAAMNLLNVLELLVLQRYDNIFRIAVLLTITTMVLSLGILYLGHQNMIAWYPVCIEAAALLFYRLYLYRQHKKNALG